MNKGYHLIVFAFYNVLLFVFCYNQFMEASMKIIYNGEEIELDDTLEPGEKELDTIDGFDTALDDTLDLTDEINRIKEIEFEDTGEIDYE